MNPVIISAFYDELNKIAMSGQQMKGINDFLARVSGAAGKSAIKSSPKTLIISKAGVKRVPFSAGRAMPPPIPAGA